MSKTYTDAADRANLIAAKVKKHFDLVQGKGITIADLNALEEQAKVVTDASKEVDELRDLLRAKTNNAQRQLDALKGQIIDVKRVIKSNFMQPKWEQFGLPDKR